MVAVTGELELRDGSRERLDADRLIAAEERGLRLLAAAVVVLAAALVAFRIYFSYLSACRLSLGSSSLRRRGRVPSPRTRAPAAPLARAFTRTEQIVTDARRAVRAAAEEESSTQSEQLR